MQTLEKQEKKKIDFDLSQFGGDEHAAMAAMYEETLKHFTVGSIVSGKILEVRDSEVLVDIGYKGFVGQEFIPTRDPLKGLTEAVKLCDV